MAERKELRCLRELERERKKLVAKASAAMIVIAGSCAPRGGEDYQ